MLAIIPARGGSKGLKDKNIRMLLGKPLIYYTIEAAQKSKNINKIIVSTNDRRIADISMVLGAEVPFMRPEELATDTSKAIDTYLYTIERLNSEFGESIEEFTVLLPTAPLRTEMDIDAAIRLYKEKNAESVISVIESECPIGWYKKVNSSGVLEDYFKHKDNSINRQEEEKIYLPNGAIYIFKYSSLKSNYNYYNNKTYPYIMSRESSIDIDNEMDLLLAEIILKCNK